MKAFLERIRLNSFQLKMIAVIVMLIDHVGHVLLPEVPLLRIIGRLAFPIFCFLIAEGFAHTRSKWKYAGRLAMFALISEIPFDLACFGTPFTLRYQNVFFTLVLGLLGLIVFEKLREFGAAGIVGGVFAAVAFGIAAEFLKTDYGWFGVALIFLFHISRSSVPVKVGSLVGLNAFFVCSNSLSPIQHYASLSVLPICLYNGEKGPSLKYLFYAFYPGHLLLLALLRFILDSMAL